MLSKANLTGSLWMIAAMAAFSIEDVLVKVVSATLPVGQILIMFGIGGAILFACYAVIKGEKLFSVHVLSRPMLLRTFFEIQGRLFFVLAITLTPLSSATVILQATPIVVVAGAAFFLRERVSLQRWIAIFIGLLGVVIIVQPGTNQFTPLSMLAVLGMLGLAGRDLASRAAPASLSTSILGLYGFLSVIAAGCLLSMWETGEFIWPDFKIQGYLLGATVAGVAAYAALMKAMRTGEVSAVTPFRYSRLLFGVLFGVLIFNEQLTVMIVLGCVLILIAGLFLAYSGTGTLSSIATPNSSKNSG